MGLRPPAPRPCESCPYRRDVPSGIWDAEEYAKLPDYDAETAYQAPGLFQCHQQDGRLCAGWVAVHNMEHCLALRLGVLSGAVDETDVDAIVDYRTDVPLFASGADAAAHGLRDLARPGLEARRMADKLRRRRPRRQG
jgi:hypothetical protein